ncbi:MAG: thioredoxin-like domain-containing protein [Longimicrobiales bacterium]
MQRTGVRASIMTMLVATGLCSGLAAGCRDDSPTESSPASLLELFGDTLLRADGSVEGIEAVEGAALIGIYFGSSQCPACASFTPMLVDAYGQLEEEGRSFEVVYVSLDPGEASMLSYMAEAGMSWLAVPWRGSHSSALLNRYDVEWIPTLVIIDDEGSTVSREGAQEVIDHGAAAYDDWLARAGG